MKNKNFLSYLFILFSLILFFIFWAKVTKYIILGKFVKLSIIVILFFYFFIGTMLKKENKRRLLIFFSYFLIILYSTNLFLGLWFKNSTADLKKEYFENNNIAYDKRDVLQFITDENKKGKEIYPLITPREILNKLKDKDSIFVSGLSNKHYAQCNESGQWKIIKTDKFGFNNRNVQQEVYDILLMGDSFADGTCASTNSEIVDLLKIHNFNTYTIGFSGNGPLLSLAALTEIKNYIKFKNIVWLVYRNDFYDLKWEFADSRLLKYLEEDFKSFNAFLNKDEIDNKYLEYYKANITKSRKQFSFWESFWELKFIDKYYNTYINKSDLDLTEDQLFILSKTFKVSKTINKNIKKFIVIYLPDYYCFTTAQEECQKEFLFIESATKDRGINTINFMDYLKKENIPYKQIFKLQIPNQHYSDYGYKQLVNVINNYLRNINY